MRGGYRRPGLKEINGRRVFNNHKGLKAQIPQ